MNIIRQEIRTGLLVVISLAVLTMVMLYIGSPGIFTTQNTFYIYLNNAGGLKQGAEVSLAGRRIGQVTKLISPVPEAERPDPAKEVKVEVQVNHSAQIYKRVKVNLTSNGLLGEYVLDFTSGEEASGLAETKTTFIGEKPPGLDDAVPLVLAKLDPALKKATETLDSLQKTADNLTQLTSPKGEIPEMLDEFRKVGVNLNHISGEQGPLRLALDNVATLTGPEGRMQQALMNIETLTSGSGTLAHALTNAEKFTADLAANQDVKLTLQNSRKATEELNATLADLRVKFSSIAANLEEATDTVKRQPWRLVWPSTKNYPTKPSATPATPAPRERRRSTH